MRKETFLIYSFRTKTPCFLNIKTSKCLAKARERQSIEKVKLTIFKSFCLFCHWLFICIDLSDNTYFFVAMYLCFKG